MNITNKFALSTAANAVVLTDDAVVATGRTSPTWIGLNPVLNAQPTTAANIPAADGGMLIDASSVKQVGRVMSAFFEIKIAHTFAAGVDNWIKIPIEYLSLNVANIRAVTNRGLIDESADGVVTAITPANLGIFVSRPQHSIVVFVDSAVLTNVAGKTLVLEVLYRQ